MKRLALLITILCCFSSVHAEFDPFVAYSVSNPSPFTLPIADFTANNTVGALPMTVQFTDLSQGNITSWLWDFENDGITDSSVQNPLHTFTQPGIYSVKLYVYDGEVMDFKLKTNYIYVLNYPNVRKVPLQYATIQNAINSSQNGDLVLVSPGEYLGNYNTFNKRITLASEYLLYGGLEQINQTVLKPLGSGTILTVNRGEDSTLVVMGFTFRDGYTSNSGGGISILNSSPTIKHNIFQNCSAANYGGAIYCYSGSPKLRNNRFEQNYCDLFGGAIALRNYSAATITDNYFSENESYMGGAVAVFSSSTPSLRTNEFGANEASYGGACFVNGASPSLVNNQLLDNYAEYDGGAVYIGWGNGVLTGNTFSQNSAFQQGGAIALNLSSSVIQTNLLSGNTSMKGGAVSLSGASTPVLSANLIQENDALDGGAVYINFASPEFTNDQFTGNNADRNGGAIYICGQAVAEFDSLLVQGNTALAGAGIYGNGASAAVNNSTFSINSATESGGGFYGDNLGLTLQTNQFTANNALYGAGVFLQNCNSFSSTGNSYTLNQATANGGGLFLGQCSQASLSQDVAYNNSAACGAGIYLSNSPASVSNVALNANVAQQNGGGIFFSNSHNLLLNQLACNHNLASQGGAIYGIDSNNSQISGVTIQNSQATKGAGIYASNLIDFVIQSGSELKTNTATGNGGAIYLSQSQGSINGSSIHNNQANQGGGLYAESTTRNPNQIDILNSKICNNSAAQGAGLYLSQTIGNLSSCLIANNQASQDGGGLYLEPSATPSLINLTVARNLASLKGGGMYCDASNYNVNSIIYDNSSPLGPEVYLGSEEANPVFEHCDIRFGITQFEGPGGGTAYDPYDFRYSLYHDPGFVAPTPVAGTAANALQANWRLVNNSFCINVGKQDLAGLLLPDSDIYGSLRQFGYRLDMGASENQFILGTNVPGDTISGDWVADSPYYNIFGQIEINPGRTLNIHPTVEVIFVCDSTLVVNGSLNANEVDFFAQLTPQWRGIEINSTATDVSITHCSILDAENPLWVADIDIGVNDVLIKAPTVQDRPLSTSPAIKLSGNNSSQLSNLQIKDYSQAISIEGGAFLAAPRISNVRIQNTTSSSSRPDTLFAINITGRSNAILEHLHLEDYEYGINLYNDTDQASAPTLQGIRIEPGQAQRVINGLTGLRFAGKIDVQVDSLSLVNFGTAIVVENNSVQLAAPPRISNVRIQNTSSSNPRTPSKGIVVTNVKQLSLENIEILNYPQGIELSNSDPGFLGLPRINNVRIQNTGSSSNRPDGVGIMFSGSLEPEITNTQISGYVKGIRCLGSGEPSLALPRISNVRIQNTSSSNPRTQYVGIELEDMYNVVVEQDSIIDCDYGIKAWCNPGSTGTLQLKGLDILHRQYPDASFPVGIFLGAGTSGTADSCRITNQHYGLQGEATGEFQITHNQFKNVSTALKYLSTTAELLCSRNLVYKDSLFAGADSTAIALVNIADLKLYNNTIYNYSTDFTASQTTADLQQNIFWISPPTASPIWQESSSLNIMYNDIAWDQGVWGGVTDYNINDNPLFVNIGTANFTLLSSSPCLDAGNPEFPRDPDGTFADLGAFTSDQTLAADFIAQPQSGYQCLTVQFNDLTNANPTEWSWDFDNNGSIDSTEQNPSHTYTAIGTYMVKLTAANPVQSDSETKISYITVFEPYLNLISPNGGEIWESGSIQNISWASSHSVNIISYSVDGGNTWYELTSDLTDGFVSPYAWLVPDSVSTLCKVKLEAWNGIAFISDSSSSVFSITGSSPAPAPGELALSFSGMDALLRWQPVRIRDLAPGEILSYLIYCTSNPADGDADYELVAETSENSFVHPNVLTQYDRIFYKVTVFVGTEREFGSLVQSKRLRASLKLRSP